MHYFKSLMLLFSAVIVVFLLTMKTHYLDRYLERKFVNDSLRNFWLKLLKMKQEPEKPCPILPPDLGPYEVKVNVSFENAINENAKLQLGGHSKPDNCTSIQKIAVIIPYRNREEHLKIWLYNMHPFLRKQQADYGIYVVEQYGETKFNKARLFNTGFSEAIKEYEYKCFFFNDVDVIPMDQRNLYRCSQNPRHLANALDRHNFRLYYPTAFGGIVAFTKDQFLKINGFSNKFWGWGKEDDELYQSRFHVGMSAAALHTQVKHKVAHAWRKKPCYSTGMSLSNMFRAARSRRIGDYPEVSQYSDKYFISFLFSLQLPFNFAAVVLHWSIDLDQ
ncbi:beta-1,4-galactosyltransferase 1-like isoform X2 [Hyperolius riggenbachi]|uniref:beta-1,4-galactosyltransferase 1-like isoform X2 n=1 Tax=Hyperolius riggenbachi TaxID=752182 RepID=UPI0035A3D376